MELLFAQSSSNVVHDLISQAFFAAFNRPETYIHAVIQDTHLLQVPLPLSLSLLDLAAGAERTPCLWCR